MGERSEAERRQLLLQDTFGAWASALIERRQLASSRAEALGLAPPPELSPPATDASVQCAMESTAPPEAAVGVQGELALMSELRQTAERQVEELRRKVDTQAGELAEVTRLLIVSKMNQAELDLTNLGLDHDVKQLERQVGNPAQSRATPRNPTRRHTTPQQSRATPHDPTTIPRDPTRSHTSPSARSYAIPARYQPPLNTGLFTTVPTTHSPSHLNTGTGHSNLLTHLTQPAPTHLTYLPAQTYQLASLASQVVIEHVDHYQIDEGLPYQSPPSARHTAF